jgi:hypothetical protein
MVRGRRVAGFSPSQKVTPRITAHNKERDGELPN